MLQRKHFTPARPINVYVFEPPAVQFLGDQHVESVILTKFTPTESKKPRRKYRRRQRPVPEDKVEWIEKGSKPVDSYGHRRRRTRASLDEGLITEGSAIYNVQRRRSRRRSVARTKDLDDEDYNTHDEPLDSDVSDEQENENQPQKQGKTRLEIDPQTGLVTESLITPQEQSGPSVNLARFLQLSDDSDDERLRQPENITGPKSQNYFLLNARANSVSQRTLDDLPLIDREAVKKAESNYIKHAAEKQLLREFHESNMPSWYLEMRAGFNLLFYGFGSKKMLLQDLARKYLLDAPVVVVNGYFPLLNIKMVLTTISEEVFGRRVIFRNPLDHLEGIKRAILERIPEEQRYLPFDRLDDDSRTSIKIQLYILIHNIDGPSLRSDRAQTILSQLANIPGIRLIASIDHINAPIMWNGSKNALFNWMWHDLTTYESYNLEAVHQASIVDEMEGDDSSKIQGTCHVLRSLTSKARSAFKLLAEFILAHDAGSSGMSYSQYISECREEFLITTDQDFRTLMIEFKDHQVIESKPGIDGNDQYTIPLSVKALRAVLKDVFSTSQ